MIRLTVAGAAGRMGRCVIDLVSRDSHFEIAAAIDLGERQSIPSCDALIDFTHAAGTMDWLTVCEAQRLAMVIGSTGHDERQQARIAEAARVIPIVQSANFSVGMQVVLGALARIAGELGSEYDVEIVETHHRHKIDSPSGTALTLLAEIQKNTHQYSDRKGAAVVFGREGKVGERPKGQIGVHAIRMGDVVGQHEIHFSGPGETVTIRHTAQSRDTFAAGALRAAAWVVGKPPGLYSMRNVLDTD